MAQTKVLIVGAGPTGLATALSLVKHGFRDFVIVEEVVERSLASRAMTIHAATLEALDSIGCADVLVDAGIKGNGMELRDRRKPFMSANFSSLKPYTKFPFVLLISQYETERILEAELKRLDVDVRRGMKAVGIRNGGEEDVIEVSFEKGDVIKAEYVVAADGAHSAIRTMAGVKFEDPDGSPPDPALRQIVFADVTFSADHPLLPKDTAMGTASNGKFFLIIPLPMSPAQTSKRVYRVGFNPPESAGPPPANPSKSYLQEHLDAQGPVRLSSHPSNPEAVHIDEVIWSTRFRTHAAIADTFLVRLGSHKPADASGRGQIVLVGDAAHIHAPAGGLGMNLGLRDAICLAPALISHIKQVDESSTYDGKVLADYIETRRERALYTIRFTKKIMAVANVVGSATIFNLNQWIFSLIGSIPFVRNRIAWNISGLGNR